MSFVSKSALVTGGAGFIGSHLVEALVDGGCRVTVLDDLSSGRESNLVPVAGRITFIYPDEEVNLALVGSRTPTVYIDTVSDLRPLAQRVFRGLLAHRYREGRLVRATQNGREWWLDTEVALRGEFAGGFEHEHPRGGLVLAQLGQDGQGEGRRFSGSGLCTAQQVGALQNNWNGLHLDRSWGGVAFFMKCF